MQQLLLPSSPLIQARGGPGSAHGRIQPRGAHRRRWLVVTSLPTALQKCTSC
jgi:hypothetical protein